MAEPVYGELEAANHYFAYLRKRPVSQYHDDVAPSQTAAVTDCVTVAPGNGPRPPGDDGYGSSVEPAEDVASETVSPAASQAGRGIGNDLGQNAGSSLVI